MYQRILMYLCTIFSYISLRFSFSQEFLKSQEMSTPYVFAYLGLNNTFAPFLFCSNSKNNSFSQVFLFTPEMAMKECNNFLNSEGKTKYEKTFYLTTPRVSKISQSLTNRPGPISMIFLWKNFFFLDFRRDLGMATGLRMVWTVGDSQSYNRLSPSS